MIQHDIHHQTHPTELQHSQRFLLLATLGIVAQLFLLASAFLLPLVSEFSLISDNISELVLGQYGMVQTVAFLFAGIGTLGLAYAIRHFTKGSRGSLVGSLLIAINGAGLIFMAFFPTDRIDSPADLLSLSATGTIHSILALVNYLCIIVGMFVLSWTFGRDARWRSLVVWSALFASGALALFFVQSEGPWVGVMQRLLVLMISAWLILAAFRVRSITTSDGASHDGRQMSTGALLR